jgi:hypothetical protein
MKRSLFALLALIALLAGCASTPPAGTVAGAGRQAAVVPGRTTRADLLATLGQTKSVVFDSGYEAWLYATPGPAGQYGEFVVLLGPDGVVKKTRQRAPGPAGE